MALARKQQNTEQSHQLFDSVDVQLIAPNGEARKKLVAVRPVNRIYG
jgi:hypothetical protein